MHATRWLIGHRLRRRWPALLVLAVIVALGSGGALLALGSAERTRNAYADFLERSDAGDVVINPVLSDREVDGLLRGLDGVRDVARDALFLAGIDDGHPRTLAEWLAEPQTTLVRGSVDGRGTSLDRPAYAEGRPISAPSEALVTRELAEEQGLELGDVIPVSFWGNQPELLGSEEDIVRPIGVEQLTVVGIVTLADEVLADDLYPRGQVIVSPEVASAYDCLPSLPPEDVTYEEAVRVLLPDGCATSYPYYSLALRGGPGAVPGTLAAVDEQMVSLNERVPAALVDFDAVHAVIATTTADEQDRVERSVQPTVAALGVLGLGTAAVTVVVAGLAVARELRRGAGEVAVWRQSGMAASERAAVLFVPAMLAVVTGLTVGLVAAWSLSTLAPVGAVRRIDPVPGRTLPGVVLVMAGALAAVATAGVASLAVAQSRRGSVRPAVQRAGGLGTWFVLRTDRPEVGQGLRAAWTRSRGAGLLVASGAVAVGVLLAAVVFGGTVSKVLSSPSDYGWRWEAAILGGYGYGNQDLEAIRRGIDGRDDVTGWDGVAIAAYAVDGEPVTGFTGFAHDGPLELTMASGRMPTGSHEVALGSRTAASIDASVGDVVKLEGDLIDPVEAKVTGIVVLPALGQYQSDRAGPGIGLVVAPELQGVDEVEQAITFIGLDLEPEVDAAAVVDALRHDLDDWEVEGESTVVITDPVRPPEIADAGPMRSVPLVVGGLLTGAAGVGLASALVVSVRGRRRELGTLRALGFTGRQLRSTVQVQAAATMAAAMAVGVPLGVVVGRLTWRAFASRLGVITEPTMSWQWILATVAGGLGAAALSAAVPGRLAARLKVGDALRAD